MSLDTNYTISQRADTAIRRAATVVLLIVGISSAILSYAGLSHLAIMAGIADSLSFLFPIVVDGMILLGSLSVLRAALARMSTWFGWMLTILGTVTSIAGNILSVENANLVSQIIHSVPPVFLCLSLETFIQLLRHRIKNTHEAKAVVPTPQTSEKTYSDAAETVAPAVHRVTSVPQEVPTPPTAAAPPSVLPLPVATQPVRHEKETAPAPAQIEETAIEPVKPVTVPEPEQPRSVDPVVAKPVPVTVPGPVAVPEKAAVAPPPVVATKPSVETSTEKQEEPRKSVPAASKPVESAPAPAARPASAQKPQAARPQPARPQPRAAGSETVELYRIILENLDSDMTKAQRIAEILRAYPDAKNNDLREALGDDPTLRIDGSVRRAKELLKSNR